MGLEGIGVRISFFLQAEDGMRDYDVTGVQTCALPIGSISIGVNYAVHNSIPKGSSAPPRAHNDPIRS